MTSISRDQLHPAYQLIISASQGNLEEVRKLLDSGVNHSDGVIVDVARRLLFPTKEVFMSLKDCEEASRSSPPKKSSSRYTALHAAVECGRIEIIHELIKRGADVNQPQDDKWGEFPLCLGKTSEVVTTLLKNGADIYFFSSKFPNSYVELLSMNLQRKLLETVIKFFGEDSEYNQNLISSLQQLPIGLTCLVKEYLGVHNLIQYENQKTGWTPLAYFVARGKVEDVRALIQLGMSPQKRISQCDITVAQLLNSRVFITRDNGEIDLLLDRHIREEREELRKLLSAT